MAPKQKSGGKNAAKVVKERQAAVEESAFGMKNKNRSRVVAREIAVAKNACITAEERRELAARKAEAEARKEALRLKKEQEKEQAQRRQNALRFLRQPPLEEGQLPGDVLCIFFKTLNYCPNMEAGCPYCHDPAMLQTGVAIAKRDIYRDNRDGTDSAPKNTITCKYFLLAVEESKMGHFWTCPNGGNKCIYRHAVPEGYVPPELRPPEQRKAGMLEDDESAILLVEAKREQLETKTKMTVEVFREIMTAKVQEEEQRAALNAAEYAKRVAQSRGKNAEAELAARERRITGRVFWERKAAGGATEEVEIDADEGRDATAELVAQMRARRLEDEKVEAEAAAARAAEQLNELEI